MGDRENYNVEEDVSMSEETVDLENKSVNKYPWLISYFGIVWVDRFCYLRNEVL